MTKENETRMPMTPNGRLRYVRSLLFDTPTEAADEWGIGRSTYYGLETEGEHSRTISPKRARQLAEKTGVAAQWILWGEGVGPHGPEECVNKNTIRLSLWLASDHSALIEIANGSYPLSSQMITIDSDEQLGPRLFLLCVPDRAMARRESPSYEEGARVFVDPSNGDDVRNYQPEDVVVAIIMPRPDPKKSKRELSPPVTVIREFSRVRNADRGVSTVLRAFNTKYEDIEFDPSFGDRLIGVVVGALWLPKRNR